MKTRSYLVPLWGLMLGLAVLPAQAATRLVGPGQTYATVAAAVAAAVGGDTIEIYAGTYAEACPITVVQPNLTIKSALGADVTIQHGPGSVADSKVLVVTATGFKLQGSAGHLFTINSAQPGSPVTLDLTAATSQCDYVKVSGVGGAAAHLYLNGPATLNNCTIDPSGGNSIIANGGNTSDLTFNDCTIKTGGGLTVYGVGLVAPGKLIFNRCSFIAPPNHPYAAITCNSFSAGGGEVIATDCNFQNYGAPIHGSAPGASANMRITLINPSRGGPNGQLGVIVNGLNLRVQGKSATNKTVIPNGGGRNIFQGAGPGTLTLTDLILNDAIETQDGNIDNPITWNIDRCILKSSPTSPFGAAMIHLGADIGQPGWGGTGSLTVNATNTIFAANGGSVAMLMFGKQTPDSVSFFHCTFFNAGNPIDELITGGNGDVITARYCIFRAAGFTTYNSTNSLNGVKNIVQGPATFAGGIPGDSLNVNPLINSAAQLLNGSPAINAAVGSVLNIDVDGRPRPLGGVNDIGAYEDIGVDDGDEELAVLVQGNSVVISWTGLGTLQSANEVTGPWMDVLDATTPMIVTSSGPKKFYRIKYGLGIAALPKVKIIDASASLPPDVNTFQYAYGPTMLYEPETGKVHTWVCANPYPARPGWDTIAYTYSTNMGATWSVPTTVLWPTHQTNERSTCDPSVVYFNGYYYMYYSGNKPNVQTLQFVARATTPEGPWFKYTTLGLWVQNSSTPKAIILPTQSTPDSAPIYGSGEASVVNVNGVLYMWHYDDTTASATLGQETPAIVLRTSTNGVDWTPLRVSNIGWGDAAHSFRYQSTDVKWNPYTKLFVMYAIKHRHEATSSIVRFFSRDGINWAGPVNEVDIPNYSHNEGFLGDKFGHMTWNTMTIVAYGCPWDMRSYNGGDWGHWDLYGHAWRDPIYVKGDFDGDGKLDPCMVDPLTGQWYIRSSLTGLQGTTDIPWGWQWSGWDGARYTLACADYDGDGKTDRAIVDSKASGGWKWYILGSTGGQGTTEIPWGWQWASVGSAYELVIGDFDGDQKTDRCIVDRYASGGGRWFVIGSTSGNGTSDIPWSWQWPDLDYRKTLICADYDGDGKTDRAYLDPTAVGGIKYHIYSSSTGGQGTTEIPWGWQWTGKGHTNTPVIADWDGDGKIDRTVVSPNSSGGGNLWFAITSGGSAPFASGWQWSGMTDYHQVVVGDYDGDQKDDRAIVDPDLGGGASWFVLGSLGGNPVPWGWQTVINYTNR